MVILCPFPFMFKLSWCSRYKTRTQHQNDLNLAVEKINKLQAENKYVYNSFITDALLIHRFRQHATGRNIRFVPTSHPYNTTTSATASTARIRIPASLSCISTSQFRRTHRGFKDQRRIEVFTPPFSESNSSPNDFERSFDFSTYGSEFG